MKASIGEKRQRRNVSCVTGRQLRQDHVSVLPIRATPLYTHTQFATLCCAGIRIACTAPNPVRGGSQTLWLTFYSSAVIKLHRLQNDPFRRASDDEIRGSILL